MLNFNPLFVQPDHADCYLKRISLPPQQALLVARALDSIFELLQQGVIDGRDGGQSATVDFRCFKETSWLEQECEQCVLPNQYAGCKLGIYMRQRNGGGRSVLEKSTTVRVYHALDDALTSLAASSGWDMPIQCDDGWLLSLPSASAGVTIVLHTAEWDEAGQGAVELTQDEWMSLSGVGVARRDGTVVADDLAAVARWAARRFSEPNGEQLRRVWRYLKASRDAHWQVDGPSEILLLTCAVQSWLPSPGRDDMALMQAFDGLSKQLLGPVHQSAVKGRNLNHLSEQGRRKTSEWATAAAVALRYGLQRAGIDEIERVLTSLQSTIDRRLPAEESAPQIHATDEKEMLNLLDSLIGIANQVNLQIEQIDQELTSLRDELGALNATPVSKEDLLVQLGADIERRAQRHARNTVERLTPSTQSDVSATFGTIDSAMRSQAPFPISYLSGASWSNPTGVEDMMCWLFGDTIKSRLKDTLTAAVWPSSSRTLEQCRTRRAEIRARIQSLEDHRAILATRLKRTGVAV